MAIPLSILHEDSHLIAINKPCGIAVIPGRNLPEGPTLLDLVESHTGAKVFVVHRLDRETSGVILFAKESATHRLLCKQFESRTVAKKYSALVLGTLDKDEIVDAPIRQFGSGRMGIDPLGKSAKTSFSVVSRSAVATLVEARPETGRRHQIRVHLFSLGHPVMGDRLYGTNRPVGGCVRLMLHSASITFQNPEGKTVEICAPFDDEWLRIVKEYL